MEKMIGIIGGIGPAATICFEQNIVERTDAEKDQEYIPMITLNDTRIPDRTAFILGESDDDPGPILVDDAKKLEHYGCTCIAMPCNTAHYFYSDVSKSVNIPVFNMLDETMKACEGMKKVGILATEGTLRSRIYEEYAKKHGVELVLPSDEDAKKVMEIIYNQVKAGKEIDIFGFRVLLKNLIDKGADSVILGCTELSVINRKYKLLDVVDPLDVLAVSIVKFCGKEVR